MAAVLQFKASDKQAVSKKLIALLKKHYKKSAPKQSLPVLETMLFGACLENTSYDDAENSYAKLFSLFHDLNEVRVSSISEISVAFVESSEPEIRAHYVRSALQFVFEKNYAFDFDVLRKKTFDQANKQLAKIKQLSPFIRAYTLQCTLGSHIVPVDDYMFHAAIWLGFIPPNTTIAKANEELKSTVRKADVVQFCHLLRCLTNDPKVRPAFAPGQFEAPEEGFDLLTAADRLAELIVKGAPKKRAKKATKKKAVKKKAAKSTKNSKAGKPATKKAKPAAKTKTVKKKTPAKSVKKKAVKKKVGVKKTVKKVAKKAAKKKTASKKTPTKKAAKKKAKKK